eukprot:366498-Chlamydomonas_euryale.AAC.1
MQHPLVWEAHATARRQVLRQPAPPHLPPPPYLQPEQLQHKVGARAQHLQLQHLERHQQLAAAEVPHCIDHRPAIGRAIGRAILRAITRSIGHAIISAVVCAIVRVIIHAIGRAIGRTLCER